MYDIVENMQRFGTSLKKLMGQDLSRSSDYATELSEGWMALNNDLDQIKIIQRHEPDKAASVRSTMDMIKQYPPHLEHRLAYYLLEHAGKDWLPFPFIQMLEALHKNHLKDPKLSTLTQWLKQIEETSTELKKGLTIKKL